MSVHKYIVSKQTSNFTTIPNNVLQGLNYNLSALGLYCYLASLPPLWEFHKEQLRKVCNVGIKKLDELLNILSDHNLITVIQIRDANGRFSFFDMQVSDGTQFISKKLSTGTKHRSAISAVRQERLDGKVSTINTIDKNNINNIKKERERKKRAPLSPFQPSEQNILLCKDYGLDLKQELESFMNRHKGEKSQYEFRRWLETALKYQSKKQIKSQEKEQSQTHCTIKEWGPGHPTYDSIYGIN